MLVSSSAPTTYLLASARLKEGFKLSLRLHSGPTHGPPSSSILDGAPSSLNHLQNRAMFTSEAYPAPPIVVGFPKAVDTLIKHPGLQQLGGFYGLSELSMERPP